MARAELQNEIIQCIEDQDIPEAYSLLMQYVDEYEMDTFYYYSYSDILLAVQDYASVLTLLNHIEEPNDLVYERLADAYFGLEEFSNALHYYLKCDYHTDQEYSYRILFMIGASYYNLEQYDKAIPFFEDYLLDKNEEDAYFFCANCYFLTHDLQRANDYYKELKSQESIINLLSFLVYHPNDALFTMYIHKLQDQNTKFMMNIHYCIQTYHIEEAIDYIESYSIDSIYKSFAYGLIYEHEQNTDKMNLFYSEVIASEITSFEDCDLFIDSMYKVNDQYYVRNNILKLYPFANESYHVFIEILRFYHDCGFYEECIDFYYNNDCNDNVDQVQIDNLMVSALNALNEFEMLLDYIENDVTNPFVSSIQFLKAKALYGLQEYEDAIEVAKPYMPDGNMAIIIISAYFRLNEMDQANDLIFDMLEQIEHDDSIPGSQYFLDFMEGLLNEKE